MQRWNWFLAADWQGKWITTNGHASVALAASSVEASLFFGEEPSPYHVVRGSIDSEGFVKASVESPGTGRPRSYELSGYRFEASSSPGAAGQTLVLTDGTTVLGLTHGPRSSEDNL